MQTMDMICLFLWLVSKLCLIYSNVVPSHVSFSMTQLVSLSADTHVFDTYVINSRLQCATLCGKNTRCMSFYVAATSGAVNGKYECKLLYKHLELHEIVPGTGSYGKLVGFVVEYKVSPAALELSPGAPVSMARTEMGLVALYDCSMVNSAMGQISLLFDHQANRWPELNEPCRASLCSQLGLADSLLSSNLEGTIYRVDVICQPDERHIGDAQCSLSGVWTLPGPVGVGCVPTSCFRRNNAGYGIYGGTTAVSVEGVTCQIWDSQSPRAHYQYPSLFTVENYDRTAAVNYCRDPDNEGIPWCYHSTGPTRWRFCDIQRCRLTFSLTLSG